MKWAKILDAPYLFAFLAIIFGIIFIKITPPLWGTDETAHFARVYQIAHGGWTVHKDKRGVYTSEEPANLVQLKNYVKEDLLDNKPGGVISRKDVDNETIYKQLTAAHFSQNDQPYPETAFYAPFAYPGPVAGVVAADIVHASIGHTIFLARLGSLIFYVAIIAFTLWLLRATKLKWLFLVTALLPISIFQASVVTADSSVLALSLLFLALLFRIIGQRTLDWRFFIPLAIIAVLLPLLKLNYFFLSFGIFLVPNKLFNSRRIATIIKTLLIILILIVSVVWVSASQAASNSQVSQRPDGAKVVASAQVSFVAHHPFSFLEICIRTIMVNADYYLQSMIAFVGWNYVAIPFIFIFLLLATLLFCAFYAKLELQALKKPVLILAGLSVIGAISIFGALYITFNPIGYRIIDGVQGRYFLPFLTPIVLAIAVYTPIEIRIKEKVVPYFFGSISVICLAITALYYYLITY